VQGIEVNRRLKIPKNRFVQCSIRLATYDTNCIVACGLVSQDV